MWRITQERLGYSFENPSGWPQFGIKRVRIKRIAGFGIFLYEICRCNCSSSGSRFVLIMQFSGNFKGKTPILSKCWAQDPPPWGQNSTGPPDQNPGSAPVQTCQKFLTCTHRFIHNPLINSQMIAFFWCCIVFGSIPPYLIHNPLSFP